MDELDKLLKSIDKVFASRVLTPEQQKLLGDYRDSLQAMQKEQGMNQIFGEMFGRHLERLDKDFYGEQMCQGYQAGTGEPGDRPTAEIREFLPGRAAQPEFFIEPYSHLEKRNQEMEL